MKTRLFYLLGLLLLLAALGHGLHSQADVLRLDIARTNSNVVLTWTNNGVALESALVLTGGAWNEITGAVSPRLIVPTNPATFFRLRGTSSPPVIDFAYRYVAPTYSVSIGLAGSSCGCASPDNPQAAGGAINSQDSGAGHAFLHTGESVQRAVDLVIPGRGLDWRFERSYRSGMNYDGPMGQGWDFNYNRRLAVESSGDVKRMDGLGRSDRYLVSGTNYQAPSGQFTRLVKNPNGSFTESDPHGMKWFYAPTNSLGICKMTNITDRVGNQMVFSYNSQGQLTNVTDTLSRSIVYSYNADGRLTNVTDFIGRTLSFGYDANGDLVSATSPAVTGTLTGNDFPGGKTTTYTYSSGYTNAALNHNLLTVTAPNEVAAAGPPFLIAQYITNPADTNNLDRLQSLTLGGTNASGLPAGGTIVYQYQNLGIASSNDFATAVFQNTVTNRAGNVTQYRFNQLGNPVSKITFTRGLRVGEPVGYTNTMVYNPDGLPYLGTNGVDGAFISVFDSSNSNRLAQGNLLQAIRLPGPRGGDQPALTNRMTYEPNFNFVTTNTDARGYSTVNRYDAVGNLTNTIHRITASWDDWEYHAFGQMAAHVHPDNGSGWRRRDTFAYYATGSQRGYLASNIVDAVGFSLITSYQYDAAGNVTRVVDPRGNDSTNIVNQLNQIVRRISPETAPGSGIRYETDTIFDANNNVVRTEVQNRDVFGALVTANSNFTTLAVMDILNHTVTTLQEISATGYITNQFRYGPNGSLTNRLFGEAANGNQPRNAIQFRHDERDLVFRQIRGPGGAQQSTSQTDYDGNGNAIRTIEGLESEPRTNTVSHDGFDRIVATFDAMGNTSTNHYDANGNLVSTRTDGQTNDVAGSIGNVRLSEVTYTHDPMDRQTRSDTAFFDTETQASLTDGQVTLLTFYSDNGQVLRSVDDNNHTNAITYDTANRQLTVTDPKSNTVTYVHDPNNNVTNIIQVDKSDLGSSNQTFVTRYTFDGLNRVIQTVDNAANTNRAAYDSRGNLILATDARGNVVSNTFDRVSRLNRTTRFLTSTGDGSGAVTNTIVIRRTYDDSGRLTQQIDNHGNATTYTYDAQNRITRTLHEDGTVFDTTFDVHDNQLTLTDPKANVVTSKYDLLDRLTTNTIVRGSAVLGVTSEIYRFDGRSRVVRAQNNDSLVTRSYDSLSQVLRETQQVLPGGPVRTVTCVYDGDGNQLSCTYPGGRTINWTYDSLDRKRTGTDVGGTNAIYSYFGPSRVERRDFGNGTRAVFTHDAIQRLTNILQTVIASGTNIDSRAYTWDRTHNVTAHDDLLPSAQDSRTYSYDSDSRLIRSAVALVGPTNIYTLDGVGNRVSVAGGSNAGNYTMSAAVPPEDYQMNQYTTTPFDFRTNNVNGNLVAADGAGGLRLFSYDYQDRLISYTNIGSGIAVTHKYDCFWRRIEKVGNGTTNRYYYSGTQEIEEQDGTNGTVATHVWGNGIDELLTSDRGGQRRFFHGDAQDSLRKVTDSTGAILEQYRYDDYGQPTFLNATGTVIPASQITNATLYTGRRYDAETGLYYYRTRFLDIKAGRFITRDSLGIWGDGANLGNGFAYVGNRPPSATDPSGQKLVCDDNGENCFDFQPLPQWPTTLEPIDVEDPQLGGAMTTGDDDYYTAGNAGNVGYAGSGGPSGGTRNKNPIPGIDVVIKKNPAGKGLVAPKPRPGSSGPTYPGDPRPINGYGIDEKGIKYNGFGVVGLGFSGSGGPSGHTRGTISKSRSNIKTNGYVEPADGQHDDWFSIARGSSGYGIEEKGIKVSDFSGAGLSFSGTGGNSGHTRGTISKSRSNIKTNGLRVRGSSGVFGSGHGYGISADFTPINSPTQR